MRPPVCTICPSTDTLRALLDQNLGEQEEARVVAHLDACESCQEAIDELAGAVGVAAQARGLHDGKPETTSAFWPALRQLKGDLVAAGAISSSAGGDDRTQFHAASQLLADSAPLAHPSDLGFLDPPVEPNTIGKLGRFHVVEMIGRGGMGMVLRALDACLRRQVAIKVLDPQYSKNEVARERFLREARLAAAITHENVVAVHHVETHRGEVPYLVMRLVKGRSLQARLDEPDRALAQLEVIRIGRQVAAGLAAAHAESLIHRDVKPANVLLEEGTDKVLLTDFGLARAAEDVSLTQSGFVAGTPLYMSPEQARGDHLDQRSDLFSLGSVMYAMATGAPPFQGSSAYTVLRAVTDAAVPPASKANPKIDGELSGLIGSLLEKKAERRIQTAAEVVDRLTLMERHAEMPLLVSGARASGLAPLARRPKWRRALVVAALMMLGADGVLLTAEALKWTRFTRIGQRGAPAAAAPEGPATTAAAAAAEGLAPLRTIEGNAGPVWSVALHPDSDELAMATEDGFVRLWSRTTGRPLGKREAHPSPIWVVAYNADGSMQATGADDGKVKLWREGAVVGELVHRSAVRSLAFSPDGKLVATGTRDGEVTVWDAAKGRRVSRAAPGHKGTVVSVAFAPDGKLVATGGTDKMVRVWDVTQVGQPGLTEVTSFGGHAGSVYAVAFAPDSTRVASGGWDHSVRVWNIEQNKQVAQFDQHTDDVWAVSFTPDGRSVVSGSEDRTVRVWEPATGRARVLRGMMGTVYCLAVGHDSATVAAGGRDGTVRVWSVE